VKVKIFTGMVTLALLVLSVLEIFQVYPGPDKIYSVYKSGYFRELDRSNSVIADSFIMIKTMTQPVRGWLSIKNFEEKYKMSINVYDAAGYLVPAPGEKGELNRMVAENLSTPDPEIRSVIDGNRYVSIIPFKNGKECRICHRQSRIGALMITRDFNASAYYTLERRLIFIPFSAFFLILFIMIVKWDPGKRIKEMFDKTTY